MVKKLIVPILFLTVACGEDNPVAPTPVTTTAEVVGVALVVDDAPTVHEDEPEHDAPELVDPVNTPLYSIVGPGGCLDYTEGQEYEWTVTVNEEGYRLRTASFHENDAGCTQTTRKGGGAFEILSESYPGDTVFEWHGHLSCGRYQADIAIGDEATENFETIVGVIINTGVDCVAVEPPDEPEDEEEPECDKDDPDSDCYEPPVEPPYVPTMGPAVGPQAYTGSPNCNITVSGRRHNNQPLPDDVISIKAAINQAADGWTICVSEYYSNYGVNEGEVIINKSITLVGLTNLRVLAIPFIIQAPNVKVINFEFSLVSTSDYQNEIAGIFVTGNSSGSEISHISFKGNSTPRSRGIIIHTNANVSNLVIRDNTFENANSGIYTNPHSGTIRIEYNYFSNNDADIGNLTGANVFNNEFSGRGEAIGIGPDFIGSEKINDNNFLFGRRINLYGVNPNVDAEYNYFNLDGINQISEPSNIDIDPEYDLPANRR